MTSTDEDPGSRGRQPRALIVTIYGLYAREVGGWLSVASIIRLMAELDVDEPAVRSSISRLKRRGILLAERVDGQAGYGLSEQARVILDEGDRRIFQRRRATVDDGWLLAVFSVPEAEREKRHLLRSRLAWLGFGTVAAGVWVAPAHLYGETRDALQRQGLDSYVDLFRAEHLAFAEVAEQVERWWDLQRLQDLYDDFLTAYDPVRASLRRKRTIDPRQAFAHYVAALTDWRRLPYSDPGLPTDVLPRGWHGVRAAETFFDLRERLSGPAHDFVTGVGNGSERPAG
ncbi:MAG: PaaX family transcriptional regulator [Actinomycetota bacterium]|nr:PaaX family transcriptional regulator [Actinomycetota bacterium]MDQ2958282.1 PaaX family transcriptional regulator [Actinomycetota bacterium]